MSVLGSADSENDLGSGFGGGLVVFTEEKLESMVVNTS